MDISQKTWKYLHGPDDVAHLSFKTGAVPRSFSVLQYSAVERDQIDMTENGIAIIDNDNMSVVLDSHMKNRSAHQADFMSQVRSLDWSAFAALALQHPRYRGSQDDFDQARPNPGVLTNQIQRGVMYAPVDDIDLRSPSMVRANVSPDCPYIFPRVTRSDALSVILSHRCTQGEDGRWRLSWTLPAHNMHPYFNRQGKTDEKSSWQKYCSENPELFDLAMQAVTEPYYAAALSTWPDSDAGRYTFCPGGPEDPNAICLETIDGAEIDFGNRGEFGAFLDALPDTALRDIWKLLRTTDHNLDHDLVTMRITEQLEPIRLEQLAALEPEDIEHASL